MTRNGKWVLAGGVLVALALAFRLFLYAFALAHLPPSSDEAWPSLMAMHILRGEFPVVYWGQTYMGTQESYIQAVLIALFGAETWVVRLYPLFFAFAFPWVTFVLARRIFNRAVAWLAMLLLAVPVPYLALCGAVIPPDNYLATATLGSLSLVVLHAIVSHPPESHLRRVGLYALLGFVLGFTLWLHMLVLSYVAVAVVVILSREAADAWDAWRAPDTSAWWLPPARMLGRGLALTLAFVVGALPLLWFNLRTGFSTFRDVGRTTDWAGMWRLCKVVANSTWTFFAGTHVMFYGDSQQVVALPGPLAVMTGVVWWGLLLLSLVWVLWRGGRILRRWWVDRTRLSCPPLASCFQRELVGALMLWGLMGVSLVMFCKSQRAGWHNTRYLIQWFSALPVLLAWGLWWVGRRTRCVAGVLAGVLLIAQIWGVALLARGWADPVLVGEKLDLPPTAWLHGWLEARGIDHAYAHYWLSYRMTFESQERRIVAEPYNERFPRRAKDVRFIDEVRAAERVAYITHPVMKYAPDMDVLLRPIGGSYRKDTVDRFTVYHSFVPPYGVGPLREIPRGGWEVKTSVHPGDAWRMLDGRPETAWSSVETQAAGMTVEVDLGATFNLCRVDFDFPGRVEEVAAGLVVEVAGEDGEDWRKVFQSDVLTLYWEGLHPRFNVYDDRTTAAFAPVRARRVRLSLPNLPKPYNRPWTVAELRMMEVTVAP